jgi:short-subunit dehydrogenase
MKALAVISGASKGIGRAIATKFAAEGFDVAVCSRTLSDLELLKREIEEAYPKVLCHVFTCDISKEEEVVAFSNAIKKLGMPIKALINNGGAFWPGSILDEKEDNLRYMMDVNLFSAYYLTRGLLPVMLAAHEPAHVFNMCSIASVAAYPASGAYSISKFAMLGFSKNLREELKNTPIKVTSILPGATLTDSWAGVEIEDNRIMTAEDVASVVWSSFGLSPQAVVEEIVLRPLKGDL